ncbi:MAG: metal-dependent hydrolase [Bacteroidales bacterium]|nr:metal-dependent hydrolase [Bacteroidales bacterium]
MTKKFILLSYAITLALLAGACSKSNPGEGPDPDPGSGNGRVGAPIETVDGHVRFYVRHSAGGAREAMGLARTGFAACKLRVNGTDYALDKDEEGNWYANVAPAASNDYQAVLIGRNSAYWYGSTAYKDVKVPYSQFYGTTLSALQDFPLYASYTEQKGNLLEMADGFAVVDVAVTGNATLTSVKVQARGGERLGGIASYLPSKGQFQIPSGSGIDFVVLNCTDGGKGVALSATPVHLYIPVAATALSQGLELTLCDKAHQMMQVTAAPELEADQVATVNVDYQPSDDLLWYEGFDLNVWGGNIVAGAGSVAFAPDADVLGIADGLGRDGYADAFTPTSCDNPGTGFIQSNTWSDVSGKTVGTSHATTDSYIQSRNLADWTYLFRCQEYQGCIAVGTGNASRGILQTPAVGGIDTFSDATASFDFCFQAGCTDDLLLQVSSATISSVRIDGEDLGITPSFQGVSGTVVIPRSKVGVPASNTGAKQWHHAEIGLERATDGTSLYFAGNDVNTGVHGFYLDNLKVVKGTDAARKGNLRLLYWNIQNGMWADQAGNYNNFVKWVKKYDPDICVWCEAASIYKDNTNSAAPVADRFLPDGWPALAARYGHAYTAVGGKRDNYPQVITSKYPVTTLLKITDTDTPGKPVAHGAAIQQVDVNGRKVAIVTCHLYPQAYGFGVTGDAARAESAARNEGDLYREFEMDYIVSHTVNADAYAEQADWLLMGDLNSRSRKDNWYYGYPADDTRLLAQDVILGKTGLQDVIAETCPGVFCSSTMGNARIDYVYASPSMMGRVVTALIVADRWTLAKPSVYVPSFYDPSDHRPVLVDFEM